MAASSDNRPPPTELTALDFAPAWAQGSPASAIEPGPSRPERPERPARHGRRGPPPEKGRERSGYGIRRPARNLRTGPSGNAAARERDGGTWEQARRHAANAPFLPLAVRFIPARHGMETLARYLAGSRRAYPLGVLTAMFLSKPESLVVSLTPDRKIAAENTDILNLFQCRTCRTVYLDKDACGRHVLSAHLNEFYAIETETVEAPRGNFTWVARCGISGELIGPPNYHGYHDRLTALHRERFAHLDFEHYRGKLEMVSDPATIAAWGESMRQSTVYRPLEKTASAKKREPGPAAPDSDAAPVAPASLHDDFTRRYFDTAVSTCASCLVPGGVARALEDLPLRQLVAAAWQREARSIMRTAITVRGMLRSLGFTAFMIGTRRAFMSAVPPRPMQDAPAVDTIRLMIEYVGKHPGCARADLWSHLGLPADSKPDNHPASLHFRWLVDKGRLIFFQDGSLALAGEAHAIRPPTTRRPGGRRRRGRASAAK